MRCVFSAGTACALVAVFSAAATASRLDNQLVQLNALVRHSDTAQVFTLGDKQGPEIHVVVPYPATDGASVGDTVALTGFVRQIVATSVRTSEGTELVPPMTISTTPAPKTK